MVLFLALKILNIVSLNKFLVERYKTKNAFCVTYNFAEKAFLELDKRFATAFICWSVQTALKYEKIKHIEKKTWELIANLPGRQCDNKSSLFGVKQNREWKMNIYNQTNNFEEICFEFVIYRRNVIGAGRGLENYYQSRFAAWQFEKKFSKSIDRNYFSRFLTVVVRRNLMTCCLYVITCFITAEVASQERMWAGAWNI